MENRRIELADGKILGFASLEISFRGTVIENTPLLSNEELSSDYKRIAADIDKEEFEAIWGQVVDVAGLIN